MCIDVPAVDVQVIDLAAAVREVGSKIGCRFLLGTIGGSDGAREDERVSRSVAMWRL